MASYIAYYRVSTGRQGQSGLGLEAQKQSVSSFMKAVDGALIGEYVEIESGKKKGRPELNKALLGCRKSKATLVIAKLDRLARNVHFISGLMEADDLPPRSGPAFTLESGAGLCPAVRAGA